MTGESVTVPLELVVMVLKVVAMLELELPKIGLSVTTGKPALGEEAAVVVFIAAVVVLELELAKIGRSVMIGNPALGDEAAVVELVMVVLELVLAKIGASVTTGKPALGELEVSVMLELVLELVLAKMGASVTTGKPALGDEAEEDVSVMLVLELVLAKIGASVTTGKPALGEELVVDSDADVVVVLTGIGKMGVMKGGGTSAVEVVFIAMLVDDEEVPLPMTGPTVKPGSEAVVVVLGNNIELEEEEVEVGAPVKVMSTVLVLPATVVVVTDAVLLPLPKIGPAVTEEVSEVVAVLLAVPLG